jgi:hypothetical protein
MGLPESLGGTAIAYELRGAAPQLGCQSALWQMEASWAVGADGAQPRAAAM